MTDALLFPMLSIIGFSQEHPSERIELQYLAALKPTLLLTSKDTVAA
jgi:hypothetical protein